MSLTGEDVRSAVAAGLVTEAQAAGLLAHAQGRAGQRAGMSEDDEPFELFRGFADVFVAVGLTLLIAGFLAFLIMAEAGLLVAVVLAGLCWGLALYFTRRRRMTLPSIVLVTGFSAGIAFGSMVLCGLVLEPEPTALSGVSAGVLTMGALGVYYRAFKVPFTFFLIGLAGLGVVLMATDSVMPGTGVGGLTDLFDLRQGSGLALGTLAFGVAAFAGGMWFDMRDPHRLGRWSATGFWLHLLAAPALVNTVALSLYNIGGVTGNLLTALALAGIAALAVVIDRRSFLTAGIGYLGVLIGWAMSSGSGEFSFALLLLVLGAFVTAMGTWWVPLRCTLMAWLPDFPGKNRLPPFSEPA